MILPRQGRVAVTFRGGMQRLSPSWSGCRCLMQQLDVLIATGANELAIASGHRHQWNHAVSGAILLSPRSKSSPDRPPIHVYPYSFHMVFAAGAWLDIRPRRFLPLSASHTSQVWGTGLSRPHSVSCSSSWCRVGGQVSKGWQWKPSCNWASIW
jgi:hypothetical protein